MSHGQMRKYDAVVAVGDSDVNSSPHVEGIPGLGQSHMLSQLIVLKTKLDFVNVLLGSLLGGRGGGGEARGRFAGKRVGHLCAFGGVRSLQNVSTNHRRGASSVSQ
jgi:hypothetical protein